MTETESVRWDEIRAGNEVLDPTGQLWRVTRHRVNGPTVLAELGRNGRRTISRPAASSTVRRVIPELTHEQAIVNLRAAFTINQLPLPTWSPSERPMLTWSPGEPLLPGLWAVEATEAVRNQRHGRR